MCAETDDRRFAHGGYMASVIYSTARQFFLDKYPQVPRPDPINSHIQFLIRVPPGPIRLWVRELNIGKQHSVVQIELQREKKRTVPSEEAYQACVLAVVTQANIAKERGLSLKTEPTIPIEDIPSRDECEYSAYPPVVEKMFPVIDKILSYNLKGGVDGKWNDRFGLSIKECWLRFQEDRGFDILSLGSL